MKMNILFILRLLVAISTLIWLIYALFTPAITIFHALIVFACYLIFNVIIEKFSKTN